MNTLRVAPLLVSTLIFNCAWGAEGSLRVAQMFLPPGARMAELVEADPQTGKTNKSLPAVLSGNLLSPRSKDVVFAYSTKAVDLPAKSLFLAVAHQTESGYTKVFEVTFYGQLLWIQDFRTVGIQLTRLPGDKIDSLIVITGIGASLGASMRIFRWNPVRGMVNMLPEAPSARKFQVVESQKGLRILCSFERFPGDSEAHAPTEFAWDGKEFVEEKTHSTDKGCPTCPH